MSLLAAVLITASVVLGMGRSVLSKTLSGIPQKSRAFYILQGIIFLSGAVVLCCYPETFKSLSLTTVWLSLIYGVMLITAQWNFTSALATGNTGICVTVYSMGFILPTLSGMIFLGEQVSFLRIIGIALAVFTVLLSCKSNSKESVSKTYIMPLIIAMLASGGLGIMQKIQQTTKFSHEKTVFILLAFGFAGFASFIKSLICKSKHSKMLKGHIISAVGVGICFCACNLINTALAGMLDTAVLFTVLNIGCILFAVVCGMVFFREKLTAKTVTVVILGISSVLFINGI